MCEALVDIDEGVQEWRYRHVKMVERIIGLKTGTGGSAGSAYLRYHAVPFRVPRPVGGPLPAVAAGWRAALQRRVAAGRQPGQRRDDLRPSRAPPGR